MLTPGQKLGHYRIVEKLGAGGMGEVYRAHDERLERDVALKVLPAGLLGDEEARRRFRQEALALARLNAPNIAAVYDFDTQAGVDFLVMELVAGVTLSDKLAQGALSEKELGRYGEQLAEGLAAAHEQNIIHRDLKPGNLRIATDGRLKILDFGLAKLVKPAGDEDATASLAQTRAVMGTLPYMAPEQLRGEPADARTDIYACGVVLYEMATGRRPFEQTVSTALAADIQHKTPPPPSRVRPEISQRLEDVILKCLEKDPENRYQSAREIAVDLRRLAGTTSVTAAIAAPAHRRGVLWLTAAAVVLLAAATGVAFNMGGLRERLFGEVARPLESLAVLPLGNLSGDPAQEYFADGMTEALIENLAKIRALRVISRTSVMQFKGTNTPLPEIARKLGVDAVVEGSVLRAGERVRITAQLVRAQPEEHLWANSYERELKDVLELQSEVARAIAGEIRAELSSQEQAQLGRIRAVNPEAHEAYLQGRFHAARGGSAGSYAAARRYLELAIEKDPAFAPAYAEMATLQVFSLPSKTWMPEARRSAEKALELDDTLAEAHAVLGLVKLFNDWDWAGAEKEFQRALELEPGSAEARHRYAFYFWAMGRTQEAVETLRRARDLDPLSSLINLDLGRAYYFVRDYDRAIECYKKAMELDPRSYLPHLLVGVTYEQKQMYDQAVSEIALSRELVRENELAQKMREAYARGGYEAYLKTWTQDWEIRVREGKAQPSSLALVYARQGNKEKAFEWLEKGLEERTRAIVYMKVEPQLDSLRGDPRFEKLLRRMNFPR